MSSDDLRDKTPQDELPFKCQWEVGVCEAGDTDDWEHYHPKAKTGEEAAQKAQEEARSDFFDPCVYMVEGPFKPRDPVRVGREMVEDVFGEVSDE